MSTVPPVPMIAPDGSFRWIPNDVVKDATSAGGRPAVRISDPHGVQHWVPQNEAHAALQNGGKLVPVANYPKPPSNQPSGLSRFLSSAVAPFKGAVEAFNGNATETEKKQGLTSIYDAALRPIERVVEAQTGQVNEARDLARQGRYSEAAGHGLASVLPLVGPWVADTAQQFYGQLGKGDVAGALGTATGNIALAAAPDVTMRGVAKALRGVSESATSAPRAMRELVKSTEKENRGIEDANEAGEKQNREDKALAKHANIGKELEHHNELKNKASEISEKDALEKGKLEKKHSQDVEDAREHNRRVRERHLQVSKRIEEENRAADNALELRRQKQADLDRATADYYAQEEAEKAKAKASENAAWSGWREKMQGVTVDGGEIAAPLRKIAQISPEVERTLHTLEPRGDEVPQESPYARLRDQTSESNFGNDYMGLSPEKQDAVDTMLLRSGHEPPSIDFDPEAGAQIPVEQLHRVDSIVNRYIRSGRFEGPLLGEMKKVRSVLRSALDRATDERGATSDLDKARAETIRYQEAFGRERPEPRTVQSGREKFANPEEYKQQQEEERIDAAARVDPRLAESAQKVRAARDELRKLPSEEQLRKSRKQAPSPPTVGDWRDGYRLMQEPSAPPRRLTSGSAEERAAQQVNQPERIPRPADFIPKEKKTISAEDIVNAKAKRAQAFADHVRHWGTYLGFVWPAIEVIRTATRGEMPEFGSTVASMLATPLAANVVARIIESPKMNWLLTRATTKDIAQIPAELRGDLPTIVHAARNRGIKVSPAMMAAAGAGTLGNQRKRVAAALTATQ